MNADTTEGSITEVMDMKIACVGDNCIDYYDETGQAYPGGNPVNVAVYLRRMGKDASYIGAVGNDVYGQRLLNALRDKGIDVDRVRICEGRTAMSHVSIISGDRVFGDYDEGVMADFRPSKEDIDFLCAHDLVVTALWGHSEGTLAAIQARGVPTAFDAADRPYSDTARIALAHTNIFFFSDDDSDVSILRDKLADLHSAGPEIIVVTRGERGSMAFDGTTFHDQAALPCRVVDTMGAGDSFIAGFLSVWLDRQPIPACMKAGAYSAVQTISYSGAW